MNTVILLFGHHFVVGQEEEGHVKLSLTPLSRQRRGRRREERVVETARLSVVPVVISRGTASRGHIAR